MDELMGLCEFCRELKPVAATDSVGREYCQDCVSQAESPRGESVMDFLANTIPFKVGDRVEARTAGVVYDGIGVIEEVSTELEKFGTPVYPSFKVVFEEKAYPEVPDFIWFMEQQLKKVS